jgi:glutathione synthase/RimK-type ligase-like ATP-grasp enzyme
MHALLALGVIGGKRMRGLQEAARRQGNIALQCIDYAEALRNPAAFHALAASGIPLKIDSPGDDPWVQHQLSLQGWQRDADLSEQGRLTQAATRAAPHNPVPPAPVAAGEFMPTRNWYAGFAQFLRAVPATAAPLTPVEDILLMTDKLNCQYHLAAHGVAIPRLLGPIAGHVHLLDLLDAAGLDRAFIKPRFGSSASGVVAYRRNRRGDELAVTTVHSSGGRRFNSKRMQRYTDSHEIAALIDALAADDAYAEAWIPKPRTAGGSYDFRVVMLDGQAQHRIARVNDAPMTNLHLDAQRAQVEDLLDEAGLGALLDGAHAAAQAFPRARLAGLDMLVRGRRAWVLEANAFGDLLPRLNWQGRDTYAAQLQALFPVDAGLACVEPVHQDQPPLPAATTLPAHGALTP